MKIELEVSDIDYADIVIKAKPYIQQWIGNMDEVLQQYLMPLAHTPNGAIRLAMWPIPRNAKDRIAVSLINRYGQKIISSAQKYADELGVDLTIADMSVQQEGLKMKIKLEVSNIDYAGIVIKAKPIVRDMLKNKSETAATTLRGLMDLPLSDADLRNVINALPQQTKDQLAVFLINHYGQNIINAAQKYANDQNVHLTIAGMSVEQ